LKNPTDLLTCRNYKRIIKVILIQAIKKKTHRNFFLCVIILSLRILGLYKEETTEDILFRITQLQFGERVAERGRPIFGAKFKTQAQNVSCFLFCYDLPRFVAF